ncbi:MAG: polysaccharide deacetylase [Clostridioides sp.]|jgi:peptidoglycan/xylan/chitin deacetylase (PgdA/CDA1 family)|nr:polysaccharide deacetylase [Clostridioides sp.]
MFFKRKKAIVGAALGLAIVVTVSGILGMKVRRDAGVQATRIETRNQMDVDQLLQESTLNEIVKASSKGVVSSETTKVAYITIDDGPSKYTNRLLNILKKNHVKATFFVIGPNMEKNKQEFRNIYNSGNSIGYHSMSHDIKKLYKSPQATLAEFDDCKAIMQKLVGDSSNLIRIPYGSKPYTPPASYNALVSNGYHIWDWNVDTLDWKSTSEQIVNNVMYYGKNSDELIVLIHEKEQSVRALDTIIRILENRGYDIRAISQEQTPKNFWEGNIK